MKQTVPSIANQVGCCFYQKTSILSCLVVGPHCHASFFSLLESIIGLHDLLYLMPRFSITASVSAMNDNIVTRYFPTQLAIETAADGNVQIVTCINESDRIKN